MTIDRKKEDIFVCIEDDSEDTREKEEYQFARLRLMLPSKGIKDSQLDVLVQTINYIHLLKRRLKDQN